MKREGRILATLALVLATATISTAYPTGSPLSVCSYLYVKHGLPPQTSPTPYVVMVNATEYSPGDIIPIRLFSPSGRTFRGFQIRVTRQTGNVEELVGQFLNLPPEAKGQIWYPQIPETSNCVTHADASDKDEVSFQWQAPADSVGDITISAIFTYKFAEFWVGQNTIDLPATMPSQDPPYEAEVHAMSAVIDHDACGVTKGCFRYPRGCNGPDCRYVVTYAVDVDNDRVTMEMMGVSKGYISLALGEGIHMPNAATHTCVKSGDTMKFQNGWNPNLYNERHQKNEFTNIEIRGDGEKIYCRFERPLVTHLTYLGQPIEKDIRKEAYVHMAWGSLYADSDAVPKKHYELPIVSDSKVNFLKHTIVSGTTMHTALAAHGVLGLVAWLALAGIAMITARHYRKVFSDMLCGSAVWFQLHRGLLICAAILAASGIIIMFTHLKAWTVYADVHAIIGLVAMGLALIMIVTGFLRPGLDSKLRPYFNWGHRLTGVGTAILAVVSCLLGTRVVLVEKDLQRILFTIIIIWLVFHIVWDLLLEVLNICYFSKAGQEYDVSKPGKTHVQEGNAEEKQSDVKSKKTTIMLILYGCYVTIVLIFVFVSSYYICLY